MSQTTASSDKGYFALKLFLTLLPTIAFLQAYAWMTLNRGIGYAFLLIWALMMLSVWQLQHKNRIIARLVRLLEIGFFFLPIATIVMTFTAGATLLGGESSGGANVGVAAGLAIGGFFVTIIAFIIGIAGGIITHLIGNNYATKADKEPAEKETKLNQHGIAFSLIGLLLISILIPSLTPSPLAQLEGSSGGTEAAVNNDVGIEEDSEPAEPSPAELGSVVIERGYIDHAEATVPVTNVSDKTIVAIKIRLRLYTKFDEPVSQIFSLSDSNVFIGLSQDEDILPGGSTELTWQLTGFEHVGKAEADVYQVKFEDGSEWRAADFEE